MTTTDTTVTVETLRDWLEQGRSLTLLDVRPAAERAEWSIPGGLHVDTYDRLKGDPSALAEVDLPADRPVVTICAAGRTSLIAAEQLRARGLEALSLAGGMRDARDRHSASSTPSGTKEQALVWARPVHDDHRADKRNASADRAWSVWAHSIHEPAPEQRQDDERTTISSVDAAEAAGSSGAFWKTRSRSSSVVKCWPPSAVKYTTGQPGVAQK